MGRNKRWKRKAKRFIGECQKHTACSKEFDDFGGCKYDGFVNCWYVSVYPSGLRTAEQLLKGYELKRW